MCVILLQTQYIEQAVIVLLLLLQPGLIVIDHGHFQYNCVSLGLALWGVVGVISNHDILGSVAFTLALNYKQMELYHALPFFFYLLGKAFQRDSGANSMPKVILKVIKLGVAVLGAFLICWTPILFVGGSHAALQVVHRMFPFRRGLYEDKVANFWCTISVLFKIRQIFSQKFLISLSFATTLLSVLPSSFILLRNPTPYQFLLSLVSVFVYCCDLVPKYNKELGHNVCSCVCMHARLHTNSCTPHPHAHSLTLTYSG